MSTYLFEKPLIRGTMLKRKSQFTALVDIDGEELIAHIPTTNRIGDVENKDLPCLMSFHDDPKRKLKYEEVLQTFTDAAAAGVAFWEVQMDFRPEGVTLYSVNKSTDL